ncbi:hypothetical protein EVAR_41825_1 [Eumeta japonica]|uniref:Uncharacterized protein n=1 Tax=Eumeta variegata TaxID=151549 RepID=A0A4C1XD93_EUMVA|nr:hypothetical protein EVAR_41825_1 [Eumeta japonica]
MKASKQNNEGTSTPAAGATSAIQLDDVIAATPTLDLLEKRKTLRRPAPPRRRLWGVDSHILTKPYDTCSPAACNFALG